MPDRERLALPTAEYNRCTYCLSARSYLGKNVARLDADEIERGTVDDVALKTARAAGVTDAEISEVLGKLELNLFTNYFNIVADSGADLPVVTPHTTPDAPVQSTVPPVVDRRHSALGP